MTANIAFNEMYAGVRVPAWHKLGQTWDAPKPPLEALQAIGGDFTIHKTPVTTSVPVIGGMEGMTVPVPLETRFALMREPLPGRDEDWGFFGVVGADYEIVQNRDIAHLLEPLAEKWPVETLGLLGRGEEFFMALTLGGWEVNGEEVKEYFLVHNGSTGTMGLNIAYTPIRVVCQNTLTAGLAAATVKAKMTHRPGIKEEMEMRLRLTEQLQNAQLAGRDAFLAMADAALNVTDVHKVLEDLYPLPNKPKRVALAEVADVSGASEGFTRLLNQAAHEYERQMAKAVEHRVVVGQMLEKFNDEFPQSANTAWAVYNAVAEYADHRPSKNGDLQFSSALFGLRAKEKEKAFRLTHKLAVAG
jgi:phage/plasmid-like protein (TIGR03299 family)